MPFLRPLLLTACFALPSHAETDLSQRVADLGLAGTIADLEALETPTPSEAFALSASHFLRGIERSFQTRYAYDLTAADLSIPGLSLDLPPNPRPRAFDAAIIERIFQDLDRDMALVRDALPTGEDVAFTLAPRDIWFDINANGRRDPEEGLVETALAAVLSSQQIADMLADDEKTGITRASIRFDASDTYWLLAYTHLLSGTSDLVLAFDPTTSIQQVYSANLEIFGSSGSRNRGFPDDETVNLIAALVATLASQPDADRTRAAHQHFLDMMDANADFWRAVDMETDDRGEWIPNPSQSGALPVSLPPETGDAWQSVLAEARAILTGELLIPHPREGFAPNRQRAQGINLAAWMHDPVPVDIVGYLHGHALRPYFERGAVADFGAMEEFDTLTGGNFGMFALFLN